MYSFLIVIPWITEYECPHSHNYITRRIECVMELERYSLHKIVDKKASSSTPEKADSSRSLRPTLAFTYALDGVVS
jgi:hypothetical protein